MTIDFQTIAVFAAIAFVASFVFGVTGFGSGLIAIPLASQFYDLRYVLAVFALLDCVNALRVASSQPRAIVRDELRRLVPACIVGVGLGSVLISVLPAWILMLALGVFVLAYVLYSTFSKADHTTTDARWAWPAGLTGGVCSAMFGAGGPPYVIYLTHRPHSKEQIRATLAATSLVSIFTRLLAFSITGMLASRAVWLTALAALPMTLFALWWAGRVHQWISREAILRGVRLLLLASGILLVIRALS